MDKRKYWLLILVSIIFLTFGFIALQQIKNGKGNLESRVEVGPTRKEMGKIFQASTPTSFPFQELTVPYLRERKYESSLGELKPAYERSAYTAYLTSYLSDGIKVNGLLTKPKGEMPQEGWPAVVFVHGYIPPARYQTLQNYSDYVDYLARNGLVVFKIDLRGHGTSEGEPGGGYYASDYVVDTLNARAALESSGFVKQNSVGLWGHSMAGNVVMRAAVARQEIPATVIWAGAVYTYIDMRTYRISDASYVPPPSGSSSTGKRRELMEKMGSPSGESWFWQQVAPANYVSDLKGAVQIHHAANDNVVSIEYSRNLKKYMDQANVPFELYEYQSGGHNLTGPSFTQAMQRTTSFYLENL